MPCFEIWVPCPDYPDLFNISSNGRLFSLRTNRELALNFSGAYLSHITKIGGRNGTTAIIKIHQQVAKAFVLNPYGLPMVNHRDSNKLNNHYRNLEWVTAKENTIHAREQGRFPKTKVQKLTLDERDFIQRNPDGLSDRDLARKFNVHHATIQYHRVENK